MLINFNINQKVINITSRFAFHISDCPRKHVLCEFTQLKAVEQRQWEVILYSQDRTF